MFEQCQHFSWLIGLNSPVTPQSSLSAVAEALTSGHVQDFVHERKSQQELALWTGFSLCQSEYSQVPKSFLNKSLEVGDPGKRQITRWSNNRSWLASILSALRKVENVAMVMNTKHTLGPILQHPLLASKTASLSHQLIS